MTTYEQITQITEVITNLEKDITTAVDSLTIVSSDDLPAIEENLQYLRNLLQDLTLQKELLITEL